MTAKQQREVVDLAFRVKTGATLTEAEQADAVPLLGVRDGETLVLAADRTLGQYHERSGPFAEEKPSPVTGHADSFADAPAPVPAAKPK